MTAAENVEEAPPRLPAVLVVVVVDDPAEDLTPTLTSVSAQAEVPMGAVVVDVTADSVVDEAAVRALVPEAVVRRAPGASWAEAVNAVLTRPERLPFMLVCRGGVRLAEDAIAHLVSEALASNAGVLGPKLVDREQPDHLRSVGLGSDKFAFPVSAVEVGELDQEQHDAVVDVFAVDTRCVLIRWDLLVAIGGIDPAIAADGDDIDLGWRSLLAGARVLVVPDAVAGVGPEPVPDRRSRLRHQVRIMLSGYGAFRLARVLPQAAIVWLVDLLAALITFRFDRCRDLLASWTANLRHLGGIRRRRRQVRQYRQVGDGEVREYQLAGSAQFRQWLAARVAFTEGSSAGRVARRRIDALSDAAVRNVLLAVVAVGVVYVFGSRHLLAGSIPAIGSLANFDVVARDGLGEWWSGWWRSGLGTDVPVPAGHAVLGAMGVVLLGAEGVLRVVLVLGAIPLGAWGMARTLAPMESRRASMVAAVVYLALPVGYNSLATGRWSALVAYAAAPWLLGQLARASASGSFAGRSTLLTATLGLGSVAAIAALFAPMVVLLVGVMAVGLVAGSVVAGNLTGMGRVLVATVGATALAFGLHLPGALALFRDGGQWAPLGASGGTEPGTISLTALLRFDTGPVVATVLVWGLFVAAAYPLVLGRGARLVWAIRAWFVAMAGWGLAWAAQWGALPVALPSTEFALVLAAVGLAMAVGIGAAVFEVDLLRHNFGWRQLLVVLAGAGLVCGLFPAVAASFDGRWSMPRGDYDDLFAAVFPEPADSGSYRVLWLGDDSVMPARGWPLRATESFALTDDGAPDILNQLVAPLDADTRAVRDAVRDATAGRSNRLGRQLAETGVRYVVVVQRIAPAPFAEQEVPLSDATGDGLSEQLDLQRIEGVNQALIFYENTSWVPSRAAVPPASDRVPEPADAQAVLVEESGANRFTGVVEAGPEVHVATPVDLDWQLTVDGEVAARGDGLGWENRFAPLNRGDAVLTYRTPLWKRLALIGQVLAWVAVMALLVNRRRARERT
ncbi:MAG: hypothetical protein OEW42_07955 [Acidimicrobiia bacterium]|nr:hypothetical protein [Acidimicrobiia bacterium]